MASKQIGWYNLKEETVFHNADFECAAWFENIGVPAGRYPLMVHDYREAKDGEVFCHCNSVYISMEGTVESDYFGTLWCGSPIGGYDSTKNAGKPSRYNTMSYTFMVAESILKNEETPYELFPEYEAREEEYEWDGKPFTSCGIYRK